jgi:quinol monooxygenase YgiN
MPAAVIVSGTFRARAGIGPEVRAAMQLMMAASRAEDGCEAYSYAQDIEDPHLVRVFEVWRDRAAFDAHRKAPHLQAWRAQWPELGLHDPQLEVMIATHREAISPPPQQA